MIPVSITLPNHLIKATCWLRNRGLPMQILGQALYLENSIFRHGIELGFFSWVQNHMNPDVEPEFPKVIL